MQGMSFCMQVCNRNQGIWESREHKWYLASVQEVDLKCKPTSASTPFTTQELKSPLHSILAARGNMRTKEGINAKEK
jgi:hypothetical protein